jgi:hypothetical protein
MPLGRSNHRRLLRTRRKLPVPLKIRQRSPELERGVIMPARDQL